MTASDTSHTNRLIHETSPYLLQHAHNPVDWWPWCAEALHLARTQHKPILLSIGYSACHWCHVMAHESFEDADTATVMNELFISIKVDREERPDLDKIYQMAYQLLNQRGGGWPLTVILTPDTHTPIFAGTYLPVQARHNLPAFKDLLQQVASYYQSHPQELQEQHAAFVHAFAQMTPRVSADTTLSAAPLDNARQELEAAFDRKHAGFGKAPKFPHPTNLERLLRHWANSRNNTEDSRALRMLTATLDAMASGGVFDQLGGGFFRYSVDDLWMIPHFEKMLYDNGPLLALYADAYAATHEPHYARVVKDIARWVMQEMRAAHGGFYASLDADSDGHEGSYYLWQPAAVRGILDTDEYPIFAAVFGLDRPANFEGKWHLHIFTGTNELAQARQQNEQAINALLLSAREKCLAVRAQRNRPGRDDKILTAWNALMIKGLAVAARRCDVPDYIDAAHAAVDFIRQNLFINNRLYACFKDGKVSLPAYLDDYAFMLDALLECLQAKFRSDDLQFAIQLADVMLDNFMDKTQGGFYFTAHDHETLLTRLKPVADEAIPAGNAIAALSLQRLGYLLGNTAYLQASEQTLRYAWEILQSQPHAHAAMLHALEEYLYPPRIIILRGDTDDMWQWQNVCNLQYQPRQLCIAIPGKITALPPALAAKSASSNTVTAYLCEGMQCLPPLSTLEKFTAALSTGRH